MMKIIANKSADVSCGDNWPAVQPTLSSKGVEVVRSYLGPRHDFIHGAWVTRDPSIDWPLYNNAMYEDLALKIGDEVVALIRVWRVLETIQMDLVP